MSYCHSVTSAEPAPLLLTLPPGAGAWPEPDSFGSGRGGVGGGAEEEVAAEGSVGCGGAVMASISCEKHPKVSYSGQTWGQMGTGEGDGYPPPAPELPRTARKFARVLSISAEPLPLASATRDDFSGASPSSSSLSA